MQDIRLGIVGSGGMATRRGENLSHLKGACVAAIVARNTTKGSPLADRLGADLHTDWRAMLDRDDIHAIVVCTHNELHGEIILTARDRSYHVFTEYPVVRFGNEADQLEAALDASGPVVRIAHSKDVRTDHQALRGLVKKLGDLESAFFHRLTPGRGGRPQVLFNLKPSGPPALFFFYHIYPIVDLFGAVDWLESGAIYTGLQENGR